MDTVAASFPLSKKGREGSVFLPSLRSYLLLLDHNSPVKCCRKLSAYFRSVDLFFCSEWCAKHSVGHFLIIMSICKYNSDKEG